jgi:hypothetical protein
MSSDDIFADIEMFIDFLDDGEDDENGLIYFF